MALRSRSVGWSSISSLWNCVLDRVGPSLAVGWGPAIVNNLRRGMRFAHFVCRTKICDQTAQSGRLHNRLCIPTQHRLGLAQTKKSSASSDGGRNTGCNLGFARCSGLAPPSPGLFKQAATKMQTCLSCGMSYHPQCPAWGQTCGFCIAARIEMALLPGGLGRAERKPIRRATARAGDPDSLPDGVVQAVLNLASVG
jgi:hypothetical protein